MGLDFSPFLWYKLTKTMGNGSDSMEKICRKDGENAYLVCERWWVYDLMMLAGGYFGAFTYSLRGGVFCNAQTGNFVLLAMALGNGQWSRALYYVIPIAAYCAGAFFSEAAERRMGKFHLIRWETALVLCEMTAVGFLGLLPETAPVQITQVLVNFICSMQYNTFRQAQGIPMATTFCTNHIRQVGVSLYGLLFSSREKNAVKLAAHLGMLASFVLGGVCSTALCIRFLGRAIWFAEIPLAIVLAALLRADLGREKGKLDQLPHGY